MIRAIQVDKAAGTLIFSDLAELFEVPLAGGSPSLLGPRPNEEVWGDFWLVGDELLFPGGFATPLIESQVGVLFSTDRALQNPRVIVGLPAAESDEWWYRVGDVTIVGDDVYWLARDSHTDRPSDLLPTWDTTYVVRRTSWREPAEPEEIYSTKSALDSLVIAGKLAFVSERVEPDADKEQRIIDLESKTVLPDTGEARFGGNVIAGDETSLFMTKLELEPPYESGIFRVAPDGGGKALLTTNPFAANFRADGEAWLFTDAQSLSDPNLVFSYRVGEEPKQIGCAAPGSTIHAVASSSSAVYAAVYLDQKTTILQFPR